MRRKLFLAALICLISVSVVFAGGSKEASSTATTEPAQKTLSLLGFLKPGGASPREAGAGELLKTFTEKTGYGLTAEIVGWEQVEPRLLTSVQSGDPPDVTFVRSQSLGLEADSGALMPLDDYIARDFTDEDKEDFLLWDQIGMYEGKKYAIVLGNEVKGVQQEVVDLCDGCIEIPQFGTKHSLNVSVTAGMLIWEFARKLKL